MTKIVLLNGPASSGKDTLAAQLVNHTPKSLMVKFAAPLKMIATHMYCDSDSQKFHQWDAPSEKIKPSPVFLGKTCRQVQIDISEVYMKPMHGEGVFGKFLFKTIERESMNDYETFFVSDSGFRPEAEVLVEAYGAQNVMLLRLHREGKFFDKDPESKSYDSRDYINLDDLGVESHDIDNIENDINGTVTSIQPILNKFLEGN